MKVLSMLRKRSMRQLLSTLIKVLKTYSISDFYACGNGVIIHSNVAISNPLKVQLGNNVYIGPDCDFFSDGGIIIGDGTVIGPHVVLMTSMHNYDASDLDALPFDDSNTSSSIRIEKFCWIGTNVIVLPGVTIGEGSVIGAGSIVTHNIPKMAICAGNPAKLIKYRDPQKYHELSTKNISWVEKYRNKHPFRIN